MIQEGHLQVYDLILTAVTPVFVGSGDEYKKIEYMYDDRKKDVRIIDRKKFFRYLLENGLADEYEKAILGNIHFDLHEFIKPHITGPGDFASMTLYKIRAENVVEDSDRGPKNKKSVRGNKNAAGGRGRLSEIKAFTRNEMQRAYIPGSSVKGAFRTAMLVHMLKDGDRLDLKDVETGKLEKELLNTLSLDNERKDSEVNSVMRGLSISDSEIISDRRMILTRKCDISVKGNKRELPVVRECIEPGTRVRFRMTIDTSVKDGICLDLLRGAVADFGKYYREYYVNKFKFTEEMFQASWDSCISLGGGSGYFGKNIEYARSGEEEGLRRVSNIMAQKFPNHKHEDDSLLISPHMLKMTNYKGKLYEYGICKVEIK